MSETTGTGFSWQKLALPVVMAALAFWLLRDFPAEQRHVGTIFALTVGLWMSEVMPLGITALVSSALLILVARSSSWPAGSTKRRCLPPTVTPPFRYLSGASS